jgi:hypothetical protein
MLIALVNHSKRVSNSDVSIMASAIQIQMDLHVAPAWNQKNPTVKFYSNSTKVPGYAWLVGIFDNPTVAGALGYHSLDKDVIDAFIFVDPVLDNKGVVLYDTTNPQNVSVSSVLSHEVCEMFGDRFASFWADGPQIAQGSQYALELCDPVESDSYEINVTVGKAVHKVSVSNFVFPSWFNQQATAKLNAPFDYLKKLKAPFTMTAGGYMIVQSEGNAQQVFGHKMPEWKRDLKSSEFYRR